MTHTLKAKAPTAPHPLEDVEPRAATSVVAVVLEHRGRLALLKRSQAVGHDRGRWHCVTGYLESGMSPQEQALTEVFEETGLRLVDLNDLQPGRTLVLLDEDHNPWRIHTFRAVTTRRQLTMNWEHVHYRWTPRAKLKRFDGQVSWLRHVVDAVYETSDSRSPVGP